MLQLGAEKAKKHIGISLRVKQAINTRFPDYGVYVATYTSGKTGQIYQRVEEETGEEFWSIRAWRPPLNLRLKDPDVLVTDQRVVKFVIEVKWGAISGCTTPDIRPSYDELSKMANLLSGSAYCRVRGPATHKGMRYPSIAFLNEINYWTNDETGLVVVSDFQMAKEMLGGRYSEAIHRWKSVSSSLLLADISERVGDIPSLQELLSN